MAIAIIFIWFDAHFGVSTKSFRSKSFRFDISFRVLEVTVNSYVHVSNVCNAIIHGNNILDLQLSMLCTQSLQSLSVRIWLQVEQQIRNMANRKMDRARELVIFGLQVLFTFTKHSVTIFLSWYFYNFFHNWGKEGKNEGNNNVVPHSQ
jgi:hypothetical protein